MFDQILNRLSRFVFVVTFFTVTISFAGLMFIAGFSERLGFDISLFDLNFYDFFIYVIVADNLNFFVGFVVFSALGISCIAYPKSLIFIFDLIYVSVFSVWCFIGGKKIIPFILICLSPLLIIPFFIFLLAYATSIKLKDFKIVNGYLFNVRQERHLDERYVNSINRIEDGSHSFFKSYLVFSIILIIFIVWLGWVVHIGKQGTKQAEKYLNSTEYKTIYFTSNTVIQGVYITKVKNGYLFVLNRNNKNNAKASFIPDNVIFRID